MFSTVLQLIVLDARVTHNPLNSPSRVIELLTNFPNSLAIVESPAVHPIQLSKFHDVEYIASTLYFAFLHISNELALKAPALRKRQRL